MLIMDDQNYILIFSYFVAFTSISLDARNCEKNPQNGRHSKKVEKLKKY